MPATPVTTAHESAYISPTHRILAAGALCWRTGSSGLEVLLIHRPKHGDWSWPKGKVDPGESLAACAVREVAEETGYHIRLGVPLPPARYVVGKNVLKYTGFWTAHITDATPFTGGPVDSREVDNTQWLPVAEARRQLTHHSDTEQLDALEQLYQTGSLWAVPLVIIRHGTAMSRNDWPGGEEDRPLLDNGCAQSAGLQSLLQAWGISAIVTSPWRRCLDTVRDLSATWDIPLRCNPTLTEYAHREAPQMVRALITALLAAGQPHLVCTHRPVLSTVCQVLRENASSVARRNIPAENPFLHPGEALISYVRPGAIPRIVSAERHRPLEL